jgi:tripartite-type tricarboxylate transporter receptor subunit TctC
MSLTTSNMTQRSRQAIQLLLFWMTCTLTFICMGEEYPNRPIKFIVPFTAGGGVDITTRLLAEKLVWNQRIVVENRPGSGSISGTDVVAKSAPDGYTFLMIAPPFTTNAALINNLPYDALKDFAPVSLIATAPLLLVVHPNLAVHTLQELIVYAKTHEGQLAYGSSGNGGPQHLAGELFKSMAKIDMIHVPYKGSAPAAIDLLGGHVQVGFGDLLTVLPYVKSGKLTPLAFTGSKRTLIMPELPSVNESALPGFEAMTWYGLVARAGTPQPLINAMQADIARVMALPEIKKRLSDEGTDVVANDPIAFGGFLKAEIEKVKKLSKITKITLD